MDLRQSVQVLRAIRTQGYLERESMQRAEGIVVVKLNRSFARGGTGIMMKKLHDGKWGYPVVVRMKRASSFLGKLRKQLDDNVVLLLNSKAQVETIAWGGTLNLAKCDVQVVTSSVRECRDKNGRFSITAINTQPKASKNFGNYFISADALESECYYQAHDIKKILSGHISLPEGIIGENINTFLHVMQNLNNGSSIWNGLGSLNHRLQNKSGRKARSQPGLQSKDHRSRPELIHAGSI